jgi:hypothetical protein
VAFAVSLTTHFHLVFSSFYKYPLYFLYPVPFYCFRELSEVGVSSVKPKGGFYIFPNFEILRAKLKARGIERCEDMVKALFDETSVSVSFIWLYY